MKKYLALFLAIIMALSCCSLAEELDPEAAAKAAAQAAQEAEVAYMRSNCDFALIEADETTGQPRLTYIEGVTAILEVDGLKFKDLNKNGKLDVYEDWRQDTEARVEDLLSQMTLEEEVGLLFCVQSYERNCRENISSFHNTCQLFNLNGTPVECTNIANNAQAACEAERLGVPMVMASDREYNAFGGYLDKAHDAYGTAYDPELAYELSYIYGESMVAVGIHVTFEPYAEEIGAQYGENPELLAKVAYAEIKGLEDSGFASCTKHWIGRGGDSSFGAARSVAQNFDNWMVGWQAALDAGCEWIMTNCGGTGISNNVDVKWDKVTMSYLRDTLGFEGVVVTDWWSLGGGPGNPKKVTGVTNEGVELSEQTAAWLYNDALLNGTTVFGGGSLIHGNEIVNDSWGQLYPDIIAEGVRTGDVDEANVIKEAKRVLRFKFNKGLFENPYRVIDEMLEIVASPEYAAEQWPITNNEELRAARRPDEVELSEKLQAESAVLVKNDNNLLPLSEGIKVYIDASNSNLKAGYIKYISNFATVVEDMEDADVVIGDFGSINDACEMLIEDAQDLEKPIVLTLNQTKPNQYALENADAVMYLSYSQAIDHGSLNAGMTSATETWIYADLLFGVREPGGIITKEITRDSTAIEWKDLAGDMGASSYVRLMIQATMEDDKQYHSSPNNWGDPLVQAFYGMSYNENPDFVYSCLILPIEQIKEEVAGSSGGTSIRVTNVEAAESGVPFTIYCLLRNNGADGITPVQAYANGELVAEKIYTVTANSWRVVEMELVLDQPGEYTITVGNQSGTMTINE